MRKNHSKIVCIKLVHLPYLLNEKKHLWSFVSLSQGDTAQHVAGCGVSLHYFAMWQTV